MPSDSITDTKHIFNVRWPTAPRLPTMRVIFLIRMVVDTILENWRKQVNLKWSTLSSL